QSRTPGSSARLQNTHQPFLGAPPHPGPVPAPHLPVHHRRPDRLLPLPVRRLDLGTAQEREPLVPVLPQVRRQRLIGRHLPSRPGQFPQALVELRARSPPLLPRSLPLLLPLPPFIPFAEQ